MDGRRNWDWHNVVDVSPFLRYEFTGDSEVNSDLNMENSEVKTYEADDALSCCSDSYDSTIFNKNYGDHDEERGQCSKKKSKKKEKYFGTCSFKNKSKKKEQDLCRECNDDDEDDGAINQVWSSSGSIGYVASRQQKKGSKSNAFDGSSMEPKEENDKLFWDTCLDS